LRPQAIDSENAVLGNCEQRHFTVPASLVGDVGATNARFALLGPGGEFRRLQVFACEDFASIEDAIDAYLPDALPLAEIARIEAAGLSVAAPVIGDRVTLTNHPWSFSIEALRRHLHVERLVVVNDFAAVAAALPFLTPDECRQVGGGGADAGSIIGALGPGSGLGAGGIVPVGGGRWIPLASQGGHVTMAPATIRESAVLDRMRLRFDHVSAERVLSGPGLVNLYNTLAELDGIPAAAYTGPQITDPQIGERDPHCREAVEMFCAMLGTVAGNLALTLGALGGIFIAGGIVPKLGQTFAASRFRQQFEQKGRMQPYVGRIGTYVITHPFPAFIGLAAMLAAEHPIEFGTRSGSTLP
jgi:glucokinase